MFDEFGLEPQAVSAGTGRAFGAWGRESHRGIAHCALRKDRDVFRWQRSLPWVEPERGAACAY
jgi:hypothetical protein